MKRFPLRPIFFLSLVLLGLVVAGWMVLQIPAPGVGDGEQLAKRTPEAETNGEVSAPAQAGTHSPSANVSPTSGTSSSNMQGPVLWTSIPGTRPMPSEQQEGMLEIPASPISRKLAGAEILLSTKQSGSSGPEQVWLVRVPDFKYPLLRVTAPMGVPEDEAAARRLVSVADHMIVKKREDLSEKDFVRELARSGYEVRREMFGPDLYLVSFAGETEPGQEAALLDAFQRAVVELSTVGRAEPDYVVETMSNVPNDPYEHLLWGMFNPTGTVTVTSGTASGQIFTEGGKMSFSGPLPAAGLIGSVIDCGFGATAADFPPAVNGHIALIQRGSGDGSPVSFATKVSNAKVAGATAVLLYNNVPGSFSGTLNSFGDWLPVIPLSQSVGQALLAALPAQATLTAVPSGKDISARTAWQTNTGSQEIVVAVIDTGIDHTHPDLAANIWTNSAETLNGLDDDGNGLVDDIRGWNFAADSNNAMDDNNHGTHCAGTIGAVGNNGVGIVGVNWNVRMVPIKFLTAAGSGVTSDGIDSVYYATSLGVHLTSNSWGGGGYTEALREAIADADAKGLLFVAAAGNSATNAPAFPAAYDVPNIISVAAADSADQLASFSNFGLPHTDIAAPGVGILSTLPTFRNPAYGVSSGTSMACPHVAGAAALLLAQAPLTHHELRERILSTADTVPSLQGLVATSGRLNVAAAVAGLSAEPGLSIRSIEISDASGNNDGVVNPGETVQLLLALDNDGFSAAEDVVGTLTTTQPHVTVVDGSANFGTIPRRGFATANDPFVVQFDPQITTPTQVGFSLTLTDAANRTWVVPFSVIVSQTYQLSGQVTLDGQPLSGATVHLTGAVASEKTTAADGTFSFNVPSGTYELQASYQGSELSRTETIERTTPDSHTGIIFALQTATISGTVFNSDTNAPIAEARVSFLGPVNEQVVTDGSGTFAFTRIYGRPVSWMVNASKFPELPFPSSPQTIPAPPGQAGVSFLLGRPRASISTGAEPGFAATLAPGASTTRTITITNTGVADLDWQVTGIGNGGGTAGAVLTEFNPPAAIANLPNVDRIEGSAYDGTHLYWLNDGMLYKQSKTGTLLSADFLPELIDGFRSSWRLSFFDGRHFWFEEKIADPADAKFHFINLHKVDLAARQIVELVELDRSVRLTEFNDAPAQWSRLRACALADGVFWALWAKVDRSDGKRYLHIARFDRYSGRLLSEFRPPSEVHWPDSNVDFPDLTFAGNSLWMTESRNISGLSGAYRRVFRLSPSDGTILQTITPAATDFTYAYAKELMVDENGALWVYNERLSTGSVPRKVRRIDSGTRIWATANQNVGTLRPGESVTLTITLDASIVGTGIYHGAIRVATNDTARPASFIPLVLNVTNGTPGNNPPVITASSPASPHTMNENSSQVFSITRSDPDGDSMTQQWAVDGVVVTGGGTSYTFATNFASQGPRSVAVRVSDGRGGVATRMWQVFVNNINRPPVASDASLTVADSDSLTVTLQANDPDGDPLTWEILSPPAVGTLKGDAPNLTYTPPPGFTGNVSLTFRVHDGEAFSSMATVTIQVGQRRISVPTAPVSVSLPYGQTATRTITVRNTGTTPLRWALSMTSSTPVADRGAVLHSTGVMPLPTGGANYLGASYGLSFDGTHLLTGLIELTDQSAFFRGHLARHDPETGALVGSPAVAPTSSSFDYLWMQRLAWTGSGIWAMNQNGFVNDNNSRIFELGLSGNSLSRQNLITQINNDFGGYNYGITWSPFGLWLLVDATSSGPKSGLYQVTPGGGGLFQTQQRFDLPPYSSWRRGPVAWSNGAFWLADRLGGSLTRLHPFTGAILEQVPLAQNLAAADMASDLGAGLFLRETTRVAHRLHTGDYLSMSPDGGTLGGGQEQVVTVTFDSTLAGAGTHSGFLRAFSDDPTQPEVQIPFSFTVGPAVGNTAPTLTSISPASPAQIPARKRTRFAISATDAEGDALTTRWLVNGKRRWNLDGSLSFDWIPTASEAGSHEIRVQVDDGRGGLAEHTWTVQVVVQPLSVQAVAAPTSGPAPLTTQLAALLSGGLADDGAVAAEPDFVLVEAENFHRWIDGSQGALLLYWIDLDDGWEGAIGGAIFAEMHSSLAGTPRSWGATAAVEYDLQFPESGTYHLWMRVRAERDDQNSCLVGLNGVQVGGAFDDENNPANYNVFRWVRHTTPFVISAGQNVFSLRIREKDYAVDRFLFTRDTDFVPTGTGPLWQSPRVPAATFSWNFGDGSPTSSQAAPQKTYAAVGSYPATVTATAAEGSAVDTVFIHAQTTYADWAASALASRPPTDRLPTANPDGDAFDNLLEYALGLDPLSPDSSDALKHLLVEDDQGADYLALRYRKAATAGDIEFRVEVSGNLSTWNWNTGGTTVTEVVEVIENPDGSETVTERDVVPLHAAPRRFLRLRVILID